MKILSLFIILMTAAPFVASAQEALPVVPYPQSVEFHKGAFNAQGASVGTEGLDDKEMRAVKGFADNLDAISFCCNGNGKSHNDGACKQHEGSDSKVESNHKAKKGGKGTITFRRDTSLAAEAYRIVVAKHIVDVFSSSYSGTFYAIRTLQQLLPEGIYGRGIRKAISPEGEKRHFAPGSEHACVKDAVLVDCGGPVCSGSSLLSSSVSDCRSTSEVSSACDRNNLVKQCFEIPCMTIEDAPRFAYRGALLDCSRHFFTVESVKNFLRVMSFYKLNRFHWHLSNDAGWRAEIKKYPELTAKGAFRKGIMTSHVKGLYRGGDYGGYYTQEQMREIVRYADSLAIVVVPEICMPSHSESALVAYPELGCAGGPYQLRNKIGVYPEIFCAGKESTYEFIDNVLGELCDIFPGEYFHIGGDECLHTRWEECPHCQAKIAELGLEDRDGWKAENFLQSYMTRRVQQMLSKRGKKLIGWDEIIDGDLDSGATVMSWRGTSGGIKAAAKGMEVIMAPTNHCYLDYIQTDMPDIEPPSIGYWLPIENVYDFNPVDGISPEQSHLVIGVECELWTEFIVTENHLHYMMLPRLLAVSEVQWSVPEQMDFSRFRKSVIQTHFPLLRSQGYVYCKAIED